MPMYTRWGHEGKMSDNPRVKGNWTRNAVLAFSAVALYQALRTSKGTLSPLAVGGLLIAILALLVGAFGPPIRRIEALGEKAVLAVLAGGLALQFAELLQSTLRYFFGISIAHMFFMAGIVACALLTLAATTGRVPSGNTWFVVLVAMHFFMGIAYLHISDVPVIDVLVVQQDASAAILRGHSPYALTFPNIYGEDWKFFYGLGNVVNGRVQGGLPYPPLTLYLCLPSYLLTGDVRYSHLAATTLAGLLIGFSGRGMLSKLAAVLFLFSPVVFLVIEHAWTEPFLVLLLGIVLFQCRLGRSPVLALGLLVASKQYVVLAVPMAAWLLIRERSLRAWSGLVLRVGAVSLAVTLPLALWNFGAFFRAVVGGPWALAGNPSSGQGWFRPDSLSIPAWLVHLGLTRPPMWPAFLAVGVAGFFLLKRLPPSGASFAISLAVMYMLLFSLSNSQAFVNYYFLVGACICASIAAADTKDRLDPGGLLEATGSESGQRGSCL